MAARIPTWKDRLKACFQWRHRLMHVFGAPAALGAIAAVASASALNPDVGLSLGALTAAVGSVIAGYYVTAGFDRKLVENLQAEQAQAEQELHAAEVLDVLRTADPAVRVLLERILYYHRSIEAVFLDGIDDQVEAILQHSRSDLSALKDRAVTMVKLYGKLNHIIGQSDGRYLYSEVQRLAHELSRTPEGSVRDALLAAKESTERTYAQWQSAIDKQRQVGSVLTVIESNLQEFKLAMELRKADAAMNAQGGTPDVSELQARLAATGLACDELVGTTPLTRRTRARA